MPGPNTSVWLCSKPAADVGSGKVELDMMNDDDTVAARRGGHSCMCVWPRSTEVKERKLGRYASLSQRRTQGMCAVM